MGLGVFIRYTATNCVNTSVFDGSIRYICRYKVLQSRYSSSYAEPHATTKRKVGGANQSGKVWPWRLKPSVQNPCEIRSGSGVMELMFVTAEMGGKTGSVSSCS
jgi:hypothetical protein